MAEPVVVSIWKDKNRAAFLCSGLLLSGRHILTVKHAFEGWSKQQSVYVRLIDGVEGAVEAQLLGAHERYDVALLELRTSVRFASAPTLLTTNVRAPDGCQIALQVIDPDNYSRAYPANYAIGNFDHDTGEYNITPQDALGHSGGVAVFEGVVIGVLSRRMKGDPLCRAVATHLFADWLQAILKDDFQPLQPAPAIPAKPSRGQYLEFVATIRARIRAMLQNPNLAEILRHWRPDPLDTYDAANPHREVLRLMDELQAATKILVPVWRRRKKEQVRDTKCLCRSLMSELAKLAVNRSDLASAAALSGDHSAHSMEIACQFAGTADVVYCSIADLSHDFERQENPTDLHATLAIHVNHHLLPHGEAIDARQEVLRKLWEKLMPLEVSPARIDGKNLLRVESEMRIAGRQDKKRFFIATPKSGDMSHGGSLRSVADDLHMSLVMYVDGQCAHLLVDEFDLIQTVLGYMRLLETI
ncbi:MAG: trypsin-like peptidase domain-containing protein [Rhodocyclaceae bacterium]|nr:trypsin-like peptidase domain-containing protein [Rhodocyclaceae bacterium]